MIASRRSAILIGLAIALGIPCLGPTRFLPIVSGVSPAVVRELFWWALLAAVLFYLATVERRSLASIGFKRPTWRSFAFGLLAAFLLVIGTIAIYAVVLPALGLEVNVAQMNALMNTPSWFRVFLITRAALTEETLFRGYGIERLIELTGNRRIAAVATWAAFTFSHLGAWDWTQLLFAGWDGLVLTALYLWRRDLVSNMTAHWLGDGAGFLLPHG